jgi:hypothetical protein
MAAEGTATHVLTSNGTGSSPTYQAIPAGVTQDYVKLESQTLASAATSITFNSYSAATYKSFIVLYNILANSAVTNLKLIINSDTSAGAYNYSKLYRRAAVITSATVADTSFELAAQDLSSGNTDVGRIEIHNAACTGNMEKAIQSSNASGGGGISEGYDAIGRWNSTSDITSIQITNDTSNGFNTGSTAILYGRL